MEALVPGDTVVVTKLDRLARSSRDLHNILHELTELDCGFVSLGETWCDTTTDVGKPMMTIMGGIAEFERSMIRKRCEDGIARAKRKGTKFGRPAALDASQKRKIVKRYAAGETMAELACEYECGEATIWRALNPFMVEVNGREVSGGRVKRKNNSRASECLRVLSSITVSAKRSREAQEEP